MKDLKNTYPKQTRERIFFAAARLQRFGEYGDEPYSRAFDNTFEMDDRELVIKGLMELAQSEPYIARGIHYLGGNTLEEWIQEAGIDNATAGNIRLKAGVLENVHTEHHLGNTLQFAVA